MRTRQKTDKSRQINYLFAFIILSIGKNFPEKIIKKLSYYIYYKMSCKR